MKTKRVHFLSLTALLAVILMLATFGCKKDSDNNNNNNNNNTGGTCWGENWLIGTWEGTTPSSVSPFANTKIRIVFDNAVLKISDSIQGNPRKVWSYDGTLTWDVGGAGEWSMKFFSANFPTPDYYTIIYECLTVTAAKQSMLNVSLRVADTVQTDPFHTIDLDWGPYPTSSSTALTTFKFYGDVEVETGGNLQRADYVPDQSDIIMTKK